jgi:Archaeal phage integrase
MRSAGSGTFARSLLPVSNPRVLSDMGLAISSSTFFDSFESYLKSQKRRNVNQVLCYARKYAAILETGDASPLFLSKSVTVKRHAMEALTVYAKYLGCYDRWQQIRRQYSLHWTDGNESIAAMQRFFDANATLESMLSRIKEMTCKLPAYMAEVIRFAVLTGLRPTEACESVRLLNCLEKDKTCYYNPEQQVLEHFRFPDIFLRPTKKTYISYLSSDMYQWIASLGSRTPTLTAIRSAVKRRGLKMEMHLCRKVFASWLHKSGIPDITIDMLQGRCPKSVLAQHYIAPDSTLRQRVLDSISQLQQTLKV